MNRSGFTLIELIATIALLAIVATISFVSIYKVIENNKIEQCKNLRDSIETAAKEYISDNRYNSNLKVSLIKTGVKVTITVGELVSKNYLSGSLVNPITEEKISDTTSIDVKLNKNYNVTEVTMDINCE